MQEIYRVAETARRVIIASPIYFGSLTGDLLNIMSRFQRYFKSRYAQLPRIGSKKVGAVILTAGGSGRVENAEYQARVLLKMLNVAEPVFITSYQTDKVPATEDGEAVKKVEELRKKWFGGV